MTVSGDMSLKEILNDFNEKYVKVRKLLDEDSKNDLENEPYMSKYKAKTVLFGMYEGLKKLLGNESSMPEIRLNAMIGVVLLNIGSIEMDTEELTASEKTLTEAAELLTPNATNPEIIIVILNVYNNLGCLWSNRDEPEKAKRYLLEAKELYENFKCTLQLPLAIEQIMKSSEEDLIGDVMQLEKAYTLTLFYLAQVYGSLKENLKSAVYCHVTLRRQLQYNVYEPIDWALNSATLSQYFAEQNGFFQSRHHLAAATTILEQYEEKLNASENNTDEVHLAKIETFRHRSADVARCWAKYCILLMTASKNRLMDDVETTASVITDMSDLTLGDNENICGGDVTKLVFPDIDVTKFESKIGDKFLLTYQDAREVFLSCQTWLNKAKEYYKLDTLASDYIELIQDSSQAYSYLAFFEEDDERRAKMHKRRIDMLEELIKEINPVYYLQYCRQLWFELGEVYSDILNIKLDKLSKTKERPCPSALKKVNMLCEKSIESYDAFINSVKDKEGRMPAKITDDLIRPVVSAYAFMGRNSMKRIALDKSMQLVHVQKSFDSYEAVVNICKSNEQAAATERAVTSRIVLTTSNQNKIMTVSGDMSLKEILNDFNEKYVKVRKLLDEDSKNDLENEPYMSKYKAKTVLFGMYEGLKKLLGNESSMPEIRLNAMIGVVLLNIGSIEMDTEELTASEKTLTEAAELLTPNATNPEIIIVILNVYNNLGCLWSNRDEPEKAKRYLLEAKELYENFKCTLQLPLAIEQIMKSSEEDLIGDVMQLEKAYTLTLFYLAQVYGSLKENLKSAVYCHVTLRRQLQYNVYEPIDWALNSATLSQYFAEQNGFFQSRHHLAAATTILEQYEEKLNASENNTDEVHLAKIETFRHRSADVARCWAKYCILLMTASKNRLMDDVETTASVITDMSDLTLGDNENICGGDVTKLVFPDIDVTKFESKIGDKFLLTYQDAREVFLSCQTWLNKAKEYYKLDTLASDYIELIQDSSQAYSYLAFFEEDDERRAKMHKRRIDMLEELIKEINPVYYLQYCRQLWFELGEVYSDILNIKLDKLSKTKERPCPSALKKVNMLCEKSIESYDAFINSVKDKEGRMPAKITDDLIRPVVSAYAFMGRNSMKRIALDKSMQLVHVQKSFDSYEAVVNICKSNEQAAATERAVTSRIVLTTSNQNKIMTVSGDMSLKEILNDFNEKYVKVRKLLDEDSKNDLENEPYMSKYKAKTVLFGMYEGLKKLLGNESSMPEIRLNAMIGVVLLNIGSIEMDTEELTASEKTLTEAAELLTPNATNPEIIIVILNVYNNLGCLWSNRDEPEKAKRYLLEAKELYENFKCTLQLPLAIEQIMKSSEEDLIGDVMQLEKAYTLTLFYLAQVYGSLKENLKSAVYCHVTLRRQLQYNVYEPIDWALNSATLSQYFAEQNGFFQSRHHLAAATTILEQYEEKLNASENNTDEVHLAKIETFRHRSADVARCWAKYCILLMTASKNRLMDDVETTASVITDMSDLTLGDNENICGGDVTKLVFPDIDVTKFESKIGDKFLLTYQDAREVFLSCQTWLNKAKEYYKLDTLASDYIELIQDSSQAYSYLAFFEEDDERRAKMHKRRIDMLEELIKEINPVYYLQYCRQLWFELGEVYSDILNIKLDKLSKTKERPCPSALKKVNMLCEKSIESYDAFINSVKDKEGRMPAKITDDLIRPVVSAYAFMGRNSMKRIALDKSMQLVHVQKSFDSYEAVVNICKSNEQAAAMMQEEFQLCQEMVNILPLKMKKLQQEIVE